MATKKEDSFENVIKNLNDISEKLSNGDIGLDEALSLYAKAAELIKKCNSIIENAEAKIRTISNGENNE